MFLNSYNLDYNKAKAQFYHLRDNNNYSIRKHLRFSVKIINLLTMVNGCAANLGHYLCIMDQWKQTLDQLIIYSINCVFDLFL